MKTQSVRYLGIGMLALGAAACGAQNTEHESAFLAGVPEQAALQLSITDDTSSEALATADDQVGAAFIGDELGSLTQHLLAPPAEAADGLARSREAAQDLNQALRDFLQPIAALVRSQEPDDVTGNVAQWGPVTRGASEYQLFVRKGLLKRFGWLLQARPEGSSGAFSNVAAGAIRVGEVVRRGHGVVGVDLDALGAADPTVRARGKLLAAFAHNPAGTALAYGLKDFTRDADEETPIDAAVQGVHLKAGFNRVRLAFHGNLPETASAAEELVLARVRHHQGEGGRADLLVSAGDVPSGKIWVVSECWNADLASAYRIVRECPGDGIGGERCVEKSKRGDVSACLRDLAQPELPPADPEANMDDPESPEEDLLPPAAMPSGDAPTDG
jgi:hypothetical protein